MGAIYTLSINICDTFVRICVQSYVQMQQCCKNNLYNFALCIVNCSIFV